MTIGAILLPVAIVTAVAVKVESDGAVFHLQYRVCLHGKVFKLIKFRSMYLGAEDDTGAVWATKGDSRMTRVGSIIRKVRIDEIPQLFNVLKGDMSMVGPRPERVEIVSRLSETISDYQHRHCVRPGPTGLAQISLPYAATIQETREKLRYDLHYITNRSLCLDLEILVRTVAVVLFGRGAR